MTQVLEHSKSQVMIAVDPHKSSWTAAAIDASLQLLAIVRVPVSDDGYRELRRFGRKWPNTHWAIEGATGLGAPLTHRLGDDGVDVVDDPAKLAARVRLLSTGHGRKSDDDDAASVGVAALTAQGLSTARMDAAVTALRAIVEHRDDLVKTRTQTVNRLHVVLTHLIPAGAPRGLSADRVAEMLHRVRPPRSCQQDYARPRRRSGRRGAATGSADRQGRRRYRSSGPRVRQLTDRAVRDRGSERRQDPRPGWLDSPVPLGCRVRQLYRHRAHRSVLR